MNKTQNRGIKNKQLQSLPPHVIIIQNNDDNHDSTAHKNDDDDNNNMHVSQTADDTKYTNIKTETTTTTTDTNLNNQSNQPDMTNMDTNLQMDSIDLYIDNNPQSYDTLFNSLRSCNLPKQEFSLKALKARYTKRKKLLKYHLEWLKRLYYTMETSINLLTINTSRPTIPKNVFEVPSDIHNIFNYCDIGKVSIHNIH